MTVQYHKHSQFIPLDLSRVSLSHVDEDTCAAMFSYPVDVEPISSLFSWACEMYVGLICETEEVQPLMVVFYGEDGEDCAGYPVSLSPAEYMGMVEIVRDTAPEWYDLFYV